MLHNYDPLTLIMPTSSSSSTGGNAVAFRPDLHRRFLAGYMEKEDDSMLAFLTSHLRMGGAYWCLTCLDLLHYDINDPKVLDLEKQSQSGGVAGSGSGREAAWSRMKKFGAPGMVTTYCPPVRGVAGAPAVVDSVAVDEPGDEKKMAAKTAEDAAVPAAEKNVSERRRNADLLTEWVLDCQNPDGGFGWDRGQDSHLTACHYALQVLAMLNKMEVLEEEEDFFRDTVAPQENEREVLMGGAAANARGNHDVVDLASSSSSSAGVEKAAASISVSRSPSSTSRTTASTRGTPALEQESAAGAGTSVAEVAVDVVLAGAPPPPAIQPEHDAIASSSAPSNSRAASSQSSTRTTRKEALLRFVIARQVLGDSAQDGDTQPSSPAKIETRRGGPHGECGCFSADRWGEATPRFVYSGIAICKILGALDRIDTNAAVRYLNTCYNLDGGFGTRPGSESHAAYTWCCLTALSLLGALHNVVDVDRTGYFLCTRQTEHGGFNGRPEKAPDVCYSWWILSSMKIIQKMHWIDFKKLGNWILQCQDTDCGGLLDSDGALVVEAQTPTEKDDDEVVKVKKTASSGTSTTAASSTDASPNAAAPASTADITNEEIMKTEAEREDVVQVPISVGGIADRPGNMPDPFHTFFGTAALSLLTHEFQDFAAKVGVNRDRVKQIHPEYALPIEVVKRMKLPE